MAIWKITPSQLTFGFNCPACFHATVVQGWKKPYQPFPSVFGLIDRAQRRYWDGMHTTAMSCILPHGTISTKEYRLRSKEIGVEGRSSRIYISGKTDCILRLDNNGLGIVDFKTTQINKLHSEYLEIYRRQLHLYAWAIEQADRPTLGNFPIGSIQTLGLLAYEPAEIVNATGLNFNVQYFPILRDDVWFSAFLGQVLDILESPCYSPVEDCEWCQIRQFSQLQISHARTDFHSSETP